MAAHPIIVSRHEAILLSSFIKMIHLDQDNRKYFTDSALAELDHPVEKEEEKSEYLRRHLAVMLSYYTNRYLKLFLGTHFEEHLEVVGPEKQLAHCPVCGYKTIERPGEYDICRVCFWEDDGNKEPDKISAVNHLSLAEARKNFALIGAITEDSLRFLDEERFIQFEKG